MITIERVCSCGKKHRQTITDNEKHEAVIDGWLALPVRYICPECVAANKFRPGETR